MDTADRIFELLDQAGLEQKQFALLIGTTDKVVSKWRTSGLKSYRKYLPQIAEVLNTSVEYLLTGQKEKPVTVSGDGQLEEILALSSKLTAEELALVIAQLKGIVADR